jgi:hypothetical protein
MALDEFPEQQAEDWIWELPGHAAIAAHEVQVEGEPIPEVSHAEEEEHVVEADVASAQRRQQEEEQLQELEEEARHEAEGKCGCGFGIRLVSTSLE